MVICLIHMLILIVHGKDGGQLLTHYIYCMLLANLLKLVLNQQ